MYNLYLLIRSNLRKVKLIKLVKKKKNNSQFHSNTILCHLCLNI